MNTMKQHLFQNGIFYMLALLIAFGLKHHYSIASSDDLDWILRPTAQLVSHISGLEFEQETQTGYINREYRMIIAPACAGVNFLIIAFCMAVFSYIHYFNQTKRKLTWLFSSIVGAYLVTLIVNTLRILIAIYFHESHVSFGWFTPARLHRVEGIVIYFLCLYGYYWMLHKIVAHNSCRIYVELIPLFWYCVIGLGVPLFNAAYRSNGRLFLEHCSVVLTVCVGIVVMLSLMRFCWNRLVIPRK
jgi:exosortase K